MLQEEKVESKDPHPWLQPGEARRKITNRQIIESTIYLSQSCLSIEEQGRGLQTVSQTQQFIQS